MNKWDKLYIEFCDSVSKLSTAKRLKVGAVLVKDNNIISYGYNGTPSGFDNNCEYTDSNSNLVTKREVIHAEINAISKAAKLGISTNQATLYCSVAPCIECAKLIMQSGITKVIYKDDYRDTAGLNLLKLKIEVTKWE
jgi:dCMP deaminase